MNLADKTAQIIQEATVLIEQKEFDAAIRILKQVLSRDTNHLDANYLLGTVYCNIGGFENARRHLMKAYKIRPNSPYICNNIGNLNKLTGNHESAKKFYNKALDLKGDLPEAHYGLGVIYRTEGNHQEADKCYSNVERLAPDMVIAVASQASLLEHQGEYKKARKILEKIIHSGEATDIQPLLNYGKVLLHSEAKKRDLLKAINLLEEYLEQNIKKIGKADVGYAYLMLGELKESVADFSSAFHCFSKGNTLLSKPFNEKAFFTKIKTLRATYAPGSVDEMPINTGYGDKFIFIVGMPRSGSTLVEQILNSHPDVYSLGESNLLEKSLVPERKLSNKGLSEASLSATFTRFMTSVGEEHKNHLFVTDKSLDNFANLGFIYQLFPNAKIIHCRRNVFDTSLSCFFHNFAGDYPYSYDLFSIGKYYKGYQGLMEHWGEVLDLDIFDIQYETLIGDTKTTVKKMLDFCGLSWNKRCMKFYRNKRYANTSSYWQVRKPIYNSSVDRYKNYEKHLDPLKKGLGLI